MSAREVPWALGAPVRAVLVGLIRLYRLVLSGWLGGQCRFYPTCSRYAEEAILEHGAIRGSAMAAWRLAKCGPFTPGGVDHVPPGRRGKPRRYDSVIRHGGIAP